MIAREGLAGFEEIAAAFEAVAALAIRAGADVEVGVAFGIGGAEVHDQGSREVALDCGVIGEGIGQAAQAVGVVPFPGGEDPGAGVGGDEGAGIGVEEGGGTADELAAGGVAGEDVVWVGGLPAGVEGLCDGVDEVPGPFRAGRERAAGQAEAAVLEAPDGESCMVEPGDGEWGAEAIGEGDGVIAVFCGVAQGAVDEDEEGAIGMELRGGVGEDGEGQARGIDIAARGVGGGIERGGIGVARRRWILSPGGGSQEAEGQSGRVQAPVHRSR